MQLWLTGDKEDQNSSSQTQMLLEEKKKTKTQMLVQPVPIEAFWHFT